jgi:transcriptional regulator with XRE-family HTH domain
MDISPDIRNRFKILRLDGKLSYQKMADILGIEKNNYSNWEKGLV